jgi:hypothetical protein
MFLIASATRIELRLVLKQYTVSYFGHCDLEQLNNNGKRLARQSEVKHEGSAFELAVEATQIISDRSSH